jgi:two-component system chemotaxis response regulator CheB
MTEAHTRDTVVIAASAGGVEALQYLLSQFPAAFPAAVLVVLHVPAAGGRALPRILARAGKLPAATASDGEEALPGHIYVAPPDHHMLFLDGKIRLSRGPRHNGHRPAADPLFISAAVARGPRVIAVVLSGTLDDGAAGCAAVERNGGLVLIQEPGDSAYEGMPRAALAVTRHPRVARLTDMGAVLDAEARQAVTAAMPGPDPDLQRQIDVFLGVAPPAAGASESWSGVTCPECGGPLRQDEAASLVRFECPAGHAWSPESLVAAQASGIERALWSAVVRLEERARLNRVLAETAGRGGYPASAGSFLSSARAAESSAGALRRLLQSVGAGDFPSPGPGADT